MRSVVQKKSYNSVTVFWLDRQALRQRLTLSVQRLTNREPNVLRVVLFGSAAEERGVPSSDVDLLLVVSDAETRFIDRPAAFREYFAGLGVEVELFVYTEAELKSNSPPLLLTALRRGKTLFSRV